MKILAAVFLCLLYNSLQHEDDYYTAAVVEFPLREKCNVTGNLNIYVKIIKEAAEKHADIIAFPAETLTGSCEQVPVPVNGILKTFPIPADNPHLYHYILVTLSKAAKENKIYVVVNLEEVLDCRRTQKGEHCPEKRKYYFNSNIVLDRTGALIARNRKIHLFGEPLRTEDTATDVESFHTDFGVTFVNIIEFDIVYQVPQKELIYQRKALNVIFTTAWHCELPFYGGVQVQAGIARDLNINMLAAGSNDWLGAGAAGAGIYSGKAGALVSVMRETNDYTLLISEVPKTPGRVKKLSYPGPIETDPSKQDTILTITDTTLDKYFTQTLEPGYQELTLNYQEITCKFIVNITLGNGTEHYVYRAAAFSGVRNMVVGNSGGIRTCSIISCTGDNIYTCGKRFPKYSSDSTAKFSSLTIIGTIPTPVVDPVTKVVDSTFYVTSMKTSLSPLQPNEVKYGTKVQGIDTEYKVSLKNCDVELLTIGFYGRKFTVDGQPYTAALIQNIVTKMNMDENACHCAQGDQ